MNPRRKVVTVLHDHGDYYNFFWTPGSMDSLARHIKEGWRLVFIQDDRVNERAVAVFERGEPGAALPKDPA